jgi:hypothetical protein
MEYVGLSTLQLAEELRHLENAMQAASQSFNEPSTQSLD